MAEDKKKKKKESAQKTPTKRGRKNLYEALDIKSKLESIRGWALNGSTDEEMFKMLGVGKETFYKWKREIPEFSDAIKRGKDIANGELLNSAFRQASGFYAPTTIVVKLKKPVKKEDGEYLIVGGKVVFEEVAEEFPTTEYVAPNSTMNIFMLKNRIPEQYKDKHEVEHSGGVKLEDFFTKDDK